MATFWATFGGNWATFNSSIWSHWLVVTNAVRIEIFRMGKF